MKLLTSSLCLALALAASQAVAQDVVTLTPGDHNIVARIGGEVFTTYHYAGDYQKPFFYPVTAAGGWDLLAKAGADAEVSKKVMVAGATADIHNDAGATAGSVKWGEVLTVAKVDGDKVWIADKDGWVAKSDLAPMAANVVRAIDPNQREHPHHKGIWLAIDEIHGPRDPNATGRQENERFWFETDKIVPVTAEIVANNANPAKLKLVNHWMGKNGQPLLEETTEVSLFANRLITYDFTLKAVAEEVTFEDTKEGLFGIRMPESMQENRGRGKVYNNEDVVGTRTLWGKAAAWIDYNGPIDGHTLGMTMMDHPDNPKTSRYHVRDYGLFAINPWGDRAYSNNRDEAHTLVLKQGETTRYRYGLWIHGADTGKEQVQAAFDQFVAAEK